jgi:hypothetical protein
MTLRLAVLATLFAGAVCRISWPGFLSFDGMYALRQARTGIETGGYPPMVSYLWVLCDHIVPGQGGMFVVQNALVFFGVAALGRALDAGGFRILIAMLMVALAPVTLGPMLVVWKDVAFGGLMALAYAVTLRYVEFGSRSTLAPALVLLALASSFRLNGVAAAAPALAAIAWTACDAPTPWSRASTAPVGPQGRRRRQLAGSMLFLLLLAATFGFVALSATWRLPDFKRIAMATGNAGTQVHDLIGISLCTGRNLVPPSLYSGEMTPERLRQLYHPEHAQLSLGASPLLDESALAANARLVGERALEARIEDPWCYLRHRARVFLYTLGANSGSVFYLTQADVFPGESGTQMKPTRLTVRAVTYILENEKSVFARSFVFALLALMALVAAVRGAHRSRAWKATLPMAGACTYLIGSFFVLPGADARYNFWANLVFMVTFCAVLPGISVPWRFHRRR